MARKTSMLAVLVGSMLVFGTAWGAPGDPFGGDDTGFVPPDTATQKCEAKISKATAKFTKCVGKCHISLAKEKYTPGAEEGCEAICEGKFDIAVGKVTNAGPPACPPGCMSTSSIRNIWKGTFDGNNGQIYCDRGCAGGANDGAQCTTNSECPGGSCGTAFDDDDPGFVPPNPSSLLCETKLETAVTRVLGCYMKCHDGRAKEKTDATGEESCENDCDASYSTKVSNLIGCASCVVTNAPTIATSLRATTDSNNGLVYCDN
jgi:hypothetical protein